MTRAFSTFLGFVTVALALVPSAFGQAAAQKPQAKNAGRQPALFSAGSKVGKTLYISGKGDYRPNAEFPEKVKNCLGEIQKTLNSAGLDMNNVVKSFVYLEDRDKYAEMNKYYGEFFPDAPARADHARSRPGARRIAA